MRFEVLPNSRRTPNEGYGVCYLWTDNWNDWFKYQTLYYLTYFDDLGEEYDLGGVKIGQFEMKDEQVRPELPDVFEELDDRFFSIGQNTDYYSTLMDLGSDTANIFLSALNDIAADSELYWDAIEEDVTGTSLLRSVSMQTIEEQYRRILGGGAVLTNYTFRYEGPSPQIEGLAPLDLEFEVIPNSKPPTNIHVLIGRNGVGKTFTLNAMTRALVLQDTNDQEDGVFIAKNGEEESYESPFSSILSITFSAFDDFEIVPQARNATEGVRYTNVGLRKRIKNKRDEWVTITRAPQDLAKEFSDSAKLCAQGIRSERWQKALEVLESDPLFAEAEVSSLATFSQRTTFSPRRFGIAAGKIYRKLSSGHKIVLLTITKLVEHVEEKTLVLMDEPEAHLHPPLLSAFVRALSNLLINRNGVAIIATHSPVVLQEVPRSCVWKIVRYGLATRATRPEIETFSENIGVLTREIFGLEVTRSGFHKMIMDAVEDEETISDVVEKFDYEVGSEGRALISGMIASRKNNEHE